MEETEHGGPSYPLKTQNPIGETSKKGTKNMEQKKKGKKLQKKIACLSKTKKNTKKMAYETKEGADEVGVMKNTEGDFVIDIDPDDFLSQLSDSSDSSDSETTSYVTAVKEFLKQVGKDILEGCKMAIVEAIKKNVFELIERKVFQKMKGKQAKSPKRMKEYV